MVAIVVRGRSVVVEACVVDLLYVIAFAIAFPTWNNEELAKGGMMTKTILVKSLRGLPRDTGVDVRSE